MNAAKTLERLSSRLGHYPKPINPEHLLKKWNISRGDEVMIMSGKDKGEVGRVESVLRQQNKLIVVQKNLAWKHIRKEVNGKGGKVQKEMPIHYSNVMLLDPNTKRPTKIEIRKVEDTETGKLKNVRFVKGTNTPIPRPKDLSYQDDWADGPMDTLPEAVAKVTYTPNPNEYPIPRSVLNELRSPYREQYDLREKAKKDTKKAAKKSKN